MNDFTQALKRLRPQGWRQLPDTDGTQVDHFAFDPAITPPTQAEVEAEIAAGGYQDARRASYPADMADFMEAYFEKHFENRPEKMDALHAQRISVKTTYPK